MIKFIGLNDLLKAEKSWRKKLEKNQEDFSQGIHKCHDGKRQGKSETRSSQCILVI